MAKDIHQPCFVPGCVYRASHYDRGTDLLVCPEHALTIFDHRHLRLHDNEAILDYLQRRRQQDKEE
jgi:hypothetical protein